MPFAVNPENHEVDQAGIVFASDVPDGPTAGHFEFLGTFGRFLQSQQSGRRDAKPATRSHRRN